MALVRSNVRTNFLASVTNGIVDVGMTMAESLLAWGDPDSTKSETGTTTIEIWLYPNNDMLEFVDGILTTATINE